MRKFLITCLLLLVLLLVGCGNTQISDTPRQAGIITKEPTTNLPTQKAETVVQSYPTTESKDYICDRNAYNCANFLTHAEAQKVFEACGGINKDIHDLDRDKDGLACESLR